MAFVLSLLLLALPSPTLLSQDADLQTGSQRVSRDIKPQPIKVVVSDICAQDEVKGKEIDLDPDSPLVLTHRIRLVPGSGAGCGQCEVDFAGIRERIESLEKEVSDLREKCGGSEGCCTSQQSKGAICTTVRPVTDECPDDCSDQGRCENGKCVCFPGFSGPDCSISDCPENCNNRGTCLNGQCVCDQGFTGPDCSTSTCPDNCNNRGRCVNGKCVCDVGFSGPVCGTRSCPENCNNKGRCVNGKCVCDPGFTGPDCSEKSCPENCNNKGKCVNGQCVCDPGFTGPDCSVKACPDNCNNRGRCINGRCICETGFTGPDCSSRACPGNCSNRGRCVNGQCVCDSGFTGRDCSSKTCPNNCNNKGRCVNGKCVCDVGFSGQDCTTKICPNNCSNRGRCVKGRCVCRRGFTGPDCSECESGFTGENCDTALTGVSHLSTRDITESSVTVFWTPPAVQYDTYHITFTSRKETDSKISSKISGRLTTYTQIGLAAGQEYTVSITGEKDGVTGAESTIEFTTLISGPKDLQVVKTTTTSVIVQWEKTQGQIDGYILSITRNQTDGSGRLPEMNLAPERDSAQIDHLEPGRLYDISLVAERGGSRSLPATVQAIPGNAINSATERTTGTVTMQTDVDGVNNKGKTTMLTNMTALFPQKQRLSKGDQKIKGRVEDSERTGNISKLITGILVRPGQKRPQPVGTDKRLPKPGTHPDIRKLNSPEIKQLNSTRIGVGGRRIVVPSSNKSAIRYPMRPKTPNVDSTISGGKPKGLKMKETRFEDGQAGNRREPVNMKIAMPGSTSQIPVATPSSTPVPFTNITESTEEPTITTEKNLTAYINGTKCVRKVLVGYRKIHVNTTSEGSAQSKNLSVIVGHVNGNHIIEKLLQVEPTLDDREFAGLDAAQPKARTYEGRISVKDKEEENKEVKEKNASVMNATPSSTRQSETTLYLSLTTTPPFSPSPLPHLPNTHLQPVLAQPERVSKHTGKKLSTADRPLRKTIVQTSSLSIPRQLPRRKQLGPSSSALEVTPLFKSTSLTSLGSQRKTDRPPSSPSHIASRSAPETLLEKKVLNSMTQDSQDSTPETVPNSTTETSKLLIKSPLEKDIEKTNRGNEAFRVTPFRRGPFRGSFPRRPNISPFKNRTRLTLDPPQHPLQGPVRRLFPSESMIRENRNQVSPIKPVRSPTAEQNGTSFRIRPNITLSRSYGTANRLAGNRKSQIKQSGTTQVSPDISQYGKGNSEMSFSTDNLMEKDNKTQEYVLNKMDDSIEHVGVSNVTSKGFELKWGAPQGKFKEFIITHTELGKDEEKDEDKEEGSEERDKDEENKSNKEEENEDESQEDGLEMTDVNKGSLSRGESVVSTQTNKSEENIKKFTTVLPGSARSHQMTNLSPQTKYSVSIFGKGPAFLSKPHNLIIYTGPEPPSNLAFGDVTDSSFSVSWIKPKSKVSGYKITHTHLQEGEPISVNVDSKTVNLHLSALSPGSTYEISVMSVLGQDESDPIKDTVTTLPDPPTDLRAINITDSKALLLWRPALATVDRYTIMYSPEGAPGSGITIKVSGNAAEQQLQALQASTEYSVTIQSQLGDRSSSGATTVFTTSSGAGKQGDSPRDLKASQVTPRTAVLSWKPPASAVTGYKLSYHTDGQDIKEVILDPTVKEYKLTRLFPMSKYKAQLQAERGGLFMAAISTDFTTGNLRFPFPTDCSQELQNGVMESGIVEVFPQGKEGKSVMVYCDMKTDGGGWTVFQRRKDGKTNFFRGWREYSNGFGELDGEFWLGNEKLHNFTKLHPMTLRVDLTVGNESVYARYFSFSVDSQKKHYTIRLSGYSGTAGDSLTYHNGRPFSTRDRDPQPFITRCAMSYRGGWWYKNCHEANLNGLYNTHINHQGVIWTQWKGKDFSIPFTEMKFRPTSFNP